ncbi:MAG TPA: hypothetical protein PLC42_03195 [Parachlamydiaceae bacterium]|nr:hypothetical protein [Parachlamydiaceae bacterium]
MSSSPVSNTGSSYVIPIAFASGQAAIKQTDSMSLFSFLQHVDTTKSLHKQSAFDSQAVDAVVNRDFFIGMVQQLQYLSRKYADVVEYANTFTNLIKNFNDRIDDLNLAINNYNIVKDNFNNRIAAMNDAINTINGISNPTASDIAAYNAAVNTFNNFLNSTGGNARLLLYANRLNNFNTQTNFDNTVVIPDLNALIHKLDLGIPDIPLLTPATGPDGSPPLPLQPLYSSTPIANLTSLTELENISQTEMPPSKNDIIETYFMPFAKAYLEALAATSKKLASIDDYRAFINFILKQGFGLDPALVDAFIMDIAKPAVQGTSPGSNGSIGNMIVGMETPHLELVLSTALFKIITADAKTPVPPHIYDQINALAVSLLAQIGASAGLSVVKLLGDKLKAVESGNPAIDIAIAAALMQNILKIVADNGKSTLDALAAIIKDIPGISEGQARQLAEKLLAAQNVSLLLNGAASVGIALKSPVSIQNILNATFNAPSFSADPPPLSIYNSSSIPENPFSSTGLNQAITNPPSSYSLQQSLTDRLAEDAKIPKPQASGIIGQALTNTAANLPSVNSTESLFKQTLADELLKQNLKQEEASFLAENAVAFINGAKPESPLTLSELGNKLKIAIQEATKSDVANVLPQSVTDNLVKILTDRNDPNSFVSLYENQIRNLEIKNDKKIIDQLKDQRREFEKPNIDSFFIFRKWLDPANNIINSYMTGLMYDKTIPSNWQRPLSIQV